MFVVVTTVLKIESLEAMMVAMVVICETVCVVSITIKRNDSDSDDDDDLGYHLNELIDW